MGKMEAATNSTKDTKEDGEEGGRQGRFAGDREWDWPWVVSGVAVPDCSLFVFLRTTIIQNLVFLTRNCSTRKRNRLHTKAMKPVFHSMFDVGRSMFDVPFGCGQRPLCAVGVVRGQPFLRFAPFHAPSQGQTYHSPPAPPRNGHTLPLFPFFFVPFVARKELRKGFCQ
jgi:hypothetical protein